MDHLTYLYKSQHANLVRCLYTFFSSQFLEFFSVFFFFQIIITIFILNKLHHVFRSFRDYSHFQLYKHVCNFPQQRLCVMCNAQLFTRRYVLALENWNRNLQRSPAYVCIRVHVCSQNINICTANNNKNYVEYEKKWK